ncbi:g-type lysozyme inhibitor [Xanthomonas sp. WHRI 1810A]|uniref:g-type lysozyme inhibitor n=1 Tax=Xanthomonas sp. WHRI 1810A TaxID=3161565 RepID=UPI0032E84FAB
MNKAMIYGFALTLGSSMCWAADKVTTVPVSFSKGANSTQVNGMFKGHDSVQYTLSAKSGQHMTVRITGSRNANFNVFAPGDTPGQSGALGSGGVGSDWAGALPTSGKYTVQVFQMRASARRGEAVPYTISFSID